MLTHYWTATMRSLKKNPLFTFINIAGLSIGIACSIFIFIYIKNELSFDHFHKNANNIYRVTTVQNNAGTVNAIATTPPPLAATLISNYPEIKDVTRIGRWYANFKSGNTIFEEKKIYAVDPSFLSFFSFPVVQGDAATALGSPDAIVLTEGTAEKYFGADWKKQNVVGKSITAKAGATSYTFAVKGVVKNLPFNSTLQFDFLLPFSFLETFDNSHDQWTNSSYYTYIKTTPATNSSDLAKKLKTHLKRYQPNTDALLSVQPLTNIYLNSNFDFNSELVVTGSSEYVKIFLIAGIIILLLACINFVNLSTARSIKRSKEVGLRKTIGASRKQLIGQFLYEASIFCALSLLLSFALVELLFPVFKTLYGKDIQLRYDAAFYGGVFVLYVVIVFLSGFYPAFFLSSFQPEKVLKGVFAAPKNMRLRQSMILLQFFFSIAMLIGTVVMNRQLQYLQEKELGFNKSHLMYVRLKCPEVKKGYRLLKHDIEQNADIAGIAASTASLVTVSNETGGFKWEGMQADDDFLMTQMAVDADFLKTTGMTLAQGRNFSQSMLTDSTAYIINETAAERMGMRNNALNKKLTFWGTEGRIIGVVKDFHFQPLTTTIQPMVLRYRPDEWHFNLLIKTKENKAAATIALVEQLYKKYDTESAFEYGFVDEELNALYKTQQGAAKIINWFTLLAIVISCMGLFGLVAYTTEQRTREIGIRKVLGADVTVIVSLLSKDFLKLVMLAFFIAAPVAWYVMYVWLQDFAYRINIDWWMIIGAGVLALVLAVLTTGFQAIKAALANPVNSLRNE